MKIFGVSKTLLHVSIKALHEPKTSQIIYVKYYPAHPGPPPRVSPPDRILIKTESHQEKARKKGKYLVYIFNIYESTVQE